MSLNLKDLFFGKLFQKPEGNYSRRALFLIRQVKIFRMAFSHFSADRVQLRASALTYYSILSIVPIIAMVFGIAKGFGFEAYLRDELLNNFSGQEKVLEWILTFVDRYISHIKGGVIAGVGIVILFWSVVKLLGNIESSFNDIWRIKVSRVISRRMSDYISLIVITPVLLLVSSSATVFFSEQIKSGSSILPLFEYIGPVLSFLVGLIPYLLIWLVFTLLYLIMPNTKVEIKSAFIGGVIAGTMFQLLQWGYFYFQSLLTSYGAIYGSFAALPLFLIWMQTSWLIVLFGAEVAFANQNIAHFEAESETFGISNHMKKIVNILILRELVINFREGNPPMTVQELNEKLGMSVRLINDTLFKLVESGLVSETVTKNVKVNAYQPAQDIQRMTIAYVFDQLDTKGGDHITINNVKVLDTMKKYVDEVLEEMRKSKSNKLIYELK